MSNLQDADDKYKALKALCEESRAKFLMVQGEFSEQIEKIRNRFREAVKETYKTSTGYQMGYHKKQEDESKI